MILTAEKLAICEQARNHLLTFLDEGPELHPCESESYSGANYLSVCAATLYGISVFKKYSVTVSVSAVHWLFLLITLLSIQ